MSDTGHALDNYEVFTDFVRGVIQQTRTFFNQLFNTIILWTHTLGGLSRAPDYTNAICNIESTVVIPQADTQQIHQTWDEVEKQMRGTVNTVSFCQLVCVAIH